MSGSSGTCIDSVNLPELVHQDVHSCNTFTYPIRSSLEQYSMETEVKFENRREVTLHAVEI